MTYNGINLPYKRYRVDKIYDRFKQVAKNKLSEIKDKSTLIFVNWNKLRKNGFYRVQVALMNNERVFYDSRSILCESIDLNSEEAFDLADRLSLELKNEEGFYWSIGNLKDLPRKFREHPLVGLD